jgi:general secretion pathway protein F
MTLFRYEAVAVSGELLSGEMDAASQDDVVQRLQRQGHIPIRADAAGGGLPRALTWTLPVRRRHGRRGLVLLTRQLATLLHAGLALDRALEIARSVVAKPADRAVVALVLDRLRGGSSLADAMAAREAMFPKFYVGLVRAGEAGGSLDATLVNLADFLERSQRAADHVRSALIYPAVVLATGVGSIAVLFGFVIPRFRPLFDEAGASLPFAARAVLWLTEAFQNWWWLMLLVLGLGVLLARYRLRQPASRRRWDGRLARLPLIGDLVVKVEIARFARTLGTLLANGVAPLAALAIGRDGIVNRAIAEALAGVGDSLKEGKGLAEPLSRARLVPELAVQLIQVGEETARLEEMLLKIAEIFEEETQRGIERLLALLVPAATILLGAIVALVMGSILTAVLSVYDLAM